MLMELESIFPIYTPIFRNVMALLDQNLLMLCILYLYQSSSCLKEAKKLTYSLARCHQQ